MKTLAPTLTKTLCSISLRIVVTIACMCAASTIAIAQVTPSGGLTDGGILQGTTTTITWPKYIEAPNIDIYLWNAATSERRDVARYIPTAQGEFVWHVPLDVVSGSKYRFVVASASGAPTRMMSTSWVTIGPTQLLKNANGSEQQSSGPPTRPVAHGQLTIAPNPTNNAVRIRFGSDFARMRIVSLDGATILERPLCGGERTVDVDVHQLTAGVYAVVLASDDGHCISSPLQIMP